MSDRDFILMINLLRLVAVNEYLRERGDEHVCSILDGVVSGFQTVLCNLKKKINYGNARSCNCSS